MKKFKEKSVDAEFVKAMDTFLKKDLLSIEIPRNVLKQIKTLTAIRKNLDPDEIDKYLVPSLLKMQMGIANSKYLISRYVSELKGGQSYAFIFRKFKTASEWNKTKKSLGINKPKPTINEIESELEKGVVNIRKTEVAYQVVADKLSSLLEWCDSVMMIIQNRIREADTDKKTTNFNKLN